MKKIIATLTSILLILSMSLCVSAGDVTPNTYTIDNVTVSFNADSEFTPDEQAYIAEMLVHGSADVAPYGLWCSLFGHSYKTGCVTTVTHCVNSKQPRCLEETFEIKECTRCGQTETTRLGYRYITCCP